MYFQVSWWVRCTYPSFQTVKMCLPFPTNKPPIERDGMMFPTSTLCSMDMINTFLFPRTNFLTDIYRRGIHSLIDPLIRSFIRSFVHSLIQINLYNISLGSNIHLKTLETSVQIQKHSSISSQRSERERRNLFNNHSHQRTRRDTGKEEEKGKLSTTVPKIYPAINFHERQKITLISWNIFIALAKDLETNLKLGTTVKKRIS